MSGARSYTTYKISIITLFSVLLAVSSFLNKFTYQTSQIISAIIYTTGIILASSPGSALMIALIAGGIYMFQSLLGFFALIAFALRGIYTEAFFILLKVYQGHVTVIRVSAAMMISSLLTGLSFYILFIHILKILPDWGLIPLLIITCIAVISNGIGSYVAVKYVIPLIKKIAFRGEFYGTP